MERNIKFELIKYESCTISFSQRLHVLTLWHFHDINPICKVNLFASSGTIIVKDFSLLMSYQGNISLRFSRNSEASASEFLENIKEMFLHYILRGPRTNECMCIITPVSKG